MMKTLSEIHEQYWPLLFWLTKRHRSMEASQHHLKGQLRIALRKDRTVYLESIAKEAETGPQIDFYRQLRKVGVTGQKKQRGPLPLPLLKDADGVAILTSEGQSERWRTFFAEQEDGILTTPSKLIREPLQQGEEQHEWTSLPSLLDYEFALRRAKCGRAYFADGVPGDVLHLGAPYLASAGYCLFLKHFLCAQEPTLFKGGRLTNMYKGKGDPAICDNHRSLFISSPLGKTHHALLRAQLNPYFDKFSLPFQLGGRKGKSVILASQCLQSFLTSSKAAGYSTAVIFIDIRNAFYKAVRSQIIETTDTVAAVHRLFETLGLGFEAFAEFQAWQDMTNAFQEAGVDKHLTALIQDAMDGTWFVQSGSNKFTETRRGTRPGDVFADQLFSFAFSRILKKVLGHLQTLDAAQTLYWSGIHSPHSEDKSQELSFLGPVWADDVAVVVRHKNPGQLLKLTQVTAGLLYDNLSTAGLQPNTSVGKSEVMISLRGSGSVQLRRRIVQEGYSLNTTSSFVLEPLRIVASYKHLGVWLLPDGSLKKELKVRFGHAHQLVTNLSTAVFKNRGLEIPTKMRLFDCLVVSALLSGAAAWPPLSPSLTKRFLTGFSKLLRRVAILHFGIAARKWTDSVVQTTLGVLPPRCHLSMARLRHLLHILQQTEDDVWAMLQQDPTWWSMLEADCDWLQQQRRFRLPLGPLLLDWENWASYILQSPQRWKHIVKRAGQHAQLQFESQAAWDTWHKEAVDTLATVCSAPFKKSLSQPLCTDYCLKCRQRFGCKAGWAVHCFRKHGRKTLARATAQSVQCGRCLKTYADHPALIRHLTYSALCRNFLSQQGVQADEQPSVNSRSVLQHSFDIRPPFLQGEGPLPLLHNPPNPYFELHEEQQRFIQTLQTSYDSIHTPDSGDQLAQTLQRLVCDSFMHQDEFIDALLRWSLHTLVSNSACDVAWRWAVSNFVDRCSADFFLDGEEGMILEVLDYQETLEHWLCIKAKVVCVPRPLEYNPILMAHIYSGHRRPGDLQDALDNLQLPAQCKGLTLSVDIVFHETYGNLLKKETYLLFVRLIRAHKLVVVCAGPPCESWSRARLHGEVDGGPRPVRHESSLHGLTALTIKELKQVMIGNALLGVALCLAIHQLCAGGFYMLEHPTTPSEPGAPSIWKLSLLRFLLEQPNVQLCKIFSGKYGAPTVKPTSLLFINGPKNAQQILQHHETVRVLPRGGSIGLSEDGTWRTSRLKAYPEALCTAMAAVILGFLKANCADAPSNSIPNEDLELIRELVISLDHSAAMGPDYHPLN